MPPQNSISQLPTPSLLRSNIGLRLAWHGFQHRAAAGGAVVAEGTGRAAASLATCLDEKLGFFISGQTHTCKHASTGTQHRKMHMGVGTAASCPAALPCPASLAATPLAPPPARSVLRGSHIRATPIQQERGTGPASHHHHTCGGGGLQAVGPQDT